MNHIRRLLCSLCVGLCITTALFAGGKQENRLDPASQEEAPEDVVPLEISVTALKGPTGIGMVRLFERRPALGEGITTDYQIAGAPDVLVSRILSGEADIATLPTNVAVKLYNSGVPYSLGAIVGNGLLYMLSGDPAVKGIDDLRGKEIYSVGKGATPDFIFRYLLETRGIRGEEGATVRFTYPHPELAQLLIAGRVKTAVLPEPFVTMVTTKNEDIRIVENLQDLWKEAGDTEEAYPMSVVVIKNDVWSSNPDAIKAFLSAYRDSISWVQDNPEAAGELAEKHGIGIPAAVAAQAIPRLNLTYVPAGEAREELEQFLKVFMDYDPSAIGGKLPDEGFYGE